MNRKKRHGLYMMLAGLALASLALVFQKSEPRIVEKTSDLEVGNRKFTLERLETEEERIMGLSGRPSLSADQGLLFVFDKPDKYGIWMKDMNFPISILWLDSECKVTGFRDVATPESYPEVFYPQLPSRYVVEVNPISVEPKIGEKLKCSFLPK